MSDNDCTNFVSQGMKAGGFPEDDDWFFEVRGVDGKGCTGYHPLSLGSELPWGDYRFPWDIGKPFCGKAWGLTDDLYNYLTITHGFQSRTFLGTKPARGNATGLVIPYAGEYMEFPTWIDKGDIVFYRQNHADWIEKGGMFNHAAIVIGWGLPTSMKDLDFKTSESRMMPHIVDHSSGSSKFGKRTINDTNSDVNQITVVHIPDNIPSYNSEESNVNKLINTTLLCICP